MSATAPKTNSTGVSVSGNRKYQKAKNAVIATVPANCHSSPPPASSHVKGVISVNAVATRTGANTPSRARAAADPVAKNSPASIKNAAKIPANCPLGIFC